MMRLAFRTFSIPSGLMIGGLYDQDCRFKVYILFLFCWITTWKHLLNLKQR